jgi:uncharacterized protein with NRDE domain
VSVAASIVTLAVMCLLVVASRLDPDVPLVIGANRDERLDRRSTAMTVLRARAPRILGGRDEEAGGTWLAVNEHGVVAGLTNRPSPAGRDPAKRSRGELPLALARYRDAPSAVAMFVRRFRPADYNPAWILVGDRSSLFALDMTGTGDPQVERLGPGLWVLENNPLGAASPNAQHVRELLGPGTGLRGEVLIERLRAVLVDHTLPPGTSNGTGTGVATGPGGDPPARVRPPETQAACVHTDAYGTRCSTVVRVRVGMGRAPLVLAADGHPCTAPFVDVSGLFEP